MLRNKCVKVVLRAQWLVTIEGSPVQCKTRFVQIFHIFFFMKYIFVDSPSNLVPRSHSVLRRGRSGYENTGVYKHGITTITRLPLSLLTRFSIILMNTFCFVIIRAALFLSQRISAIKCYIHTYVTTN